jgi:hypothetical protein
MLMAENHTERSKIVLAVKECYCSIKLTFSTIRIKIQCNIDLFILLVNRENQFQEGKHQ